LPAEISFPFFVGHAHHIFEQRGWDIEIISFQSASELSQSFQSGELDMMLSDIVTTILLQTSGLKAKAIGTIRGSVPNEGRIAIVAAPGSGIFRLKDLEGRGIALSQNTHAEYVFDKLMEMDGNKLNSTNKIKIPKLPLRYTLLMANKIPAAVLPEPTATLAQNNGAFVLQDDSSENLSQIVLTTHMQFLDKHAEEMASFIEAYNETTDLINEFPDKFRSQFITSCRIPEELADTYPLRQFSPVRPVNKKKWELVNTWLKKKGLLNQDITFEDATKNFVKEASY
jgi:NitT/TauT family transport system substrate-binding protein